MAPKVGVVDLPAWNPADKISLGGALIQTAMFPFGCFSSLHPGEASTYRYLYTLLHSYAHLFTKTVELSGLDVGSLGNTCFRPTLRSWSIATAPQWTWVIFHRCGVTSTTNSSINYLILRRIVATPAVYATSTAARAQTASWYRRRHAIARINCFLVPCFGWARAT